jgi:branched-chain amino acid transport system permease protein
MANASRDNYERTQFVGYDPKVIRYWQFILSGFFAGLAGGMYCLVYEIVTFDTLAAVKSANALLATYIGGAVGFFGPIMGAVLMVIYAPGGLLGLLANHIPIIRMGRLGELAVPYLRIVVPTLMMTVGFVLFVELVTHQTINAAQGKKFSLLGFAPDPGGTVVWVAAIAAMVVGAIWVRFESRFFMAKWNALIEDAKARGIVA